MDRHRVPGRGTGGRCTGGALTLSPTAEQQPAFVCLYAIDERGTGSLLSHTPVTLRDAEPGTPVTVETELDPVVWDVPTGHRLAVVVDSKDARYTSESRLGDRIEITSPEAASSQITVPFA